MADIKKSGESGTIVWDASGFPTVKDFRYGLTLTDDFTSASTTGEIGWSTTTSGGTVSANSTPATNDNAAGVTVIFAQTVNNYASLFTTFNKFPLWDGKHYMEWRVKLLNLDDGSDTYEVYFGLADNNTVASPNDGLYWHYDRSTNGDFWTVNSAQGGTTTTYVADGGGGRSTAAVTAGNGEYQRFSMVADPANASAKFYFNGALVTEITTNLPDTAGDFASPIIGLVKTALSAVNQAVYVDYMRYTYIRNTPVD